MFKIFVFMSIVFPSTIANASILYGMCTYAVSQLWEEALSVGSAGAGGVVVGSSA